MTTSGEFLYGVNEWVLLSIAFIVLYGGAEIGFRYGQRFAHRTNTTLHSHISTIEGALLGLMALLLGFAFAMAISRFESRKQTVLEEVNDLETTYLRAHLLPTPHHQTATTLLEEYLDSRIAYLQAGSDRNRIAQTQQASQRLQAQLWANAVHAARDNSNEVTTGYYILSLNQLIDDHAKRTMAMENHVPEVILDLLLLVSLLTISVTGYSSGLRGKRLKALRVILVVLISATLTVIIDLDRPRRGLIRVSEEGMLRLKGSFQEFHQEASLQ